MPGEGSPPCSDSGCVTHQIAPTDMVIAVMGLTGAGKSTFISLATGSSVGVGHGLQSCTDKVNVVCCPHPKGGGRHVVFVDTPGFDDTNLKDIDILESIANWLKQTYQMKIKLSGLLYCHRISDNRMAGAPMKNLKMFRDLCGADALQNVIVVTTMWDVVDPAEGELRENELKTDFWKSMFEQGVRTARFYGSYESAWNIIKLLDSSTPKATLIQKEMVDKNLSLDKTTAGRSLLGLIRELMRRLHVTLQKLSRSINPQTSKEHKVIKERLAVLAEQSARLSDPRSSSKPSFRQNQPPSRPQTPPLLVSCFPNTHSSDYLPLLGPNEIAMGNTTAILREVQAAPEPRLQEVSSLVLEISERVYRMRLAKEEITTLVNGAGAFLGTVAANAGPLNINEEMYKGIDDFCKASEDVCKMLQAIELEEHQERKEHVTLGACNEALKRACTLFDLNLDNMVALSSAEAELAELRERVADKKRTPASPHPIIDAQRPRASSFRSPSISRFFQKGTKGKDLQRRSSTSQISGSEQRPGSAKSPLAGSSSRPYHSEEIRPMCVPDALPQTPSTTENLSTATLVDNASGLHHTVVLSRDKQPPDLPRLLTDSGTLKELNPTLRTLRASDLQIELVVTPPTTSLAMDHIGGGTAKASGLDDDAIPSHFHTSGGSPPETPELLFDSDNFKLEVTAMDLGYPFQETRDLTNEVERIGSNPYASGGFGDIWRGRWTKPHQPVGDLVAIKVLRLSEQNTALWGKAEKRLRRELCVWQQLDHPNLLPLCGVVYNCGSYPSFVCPWMEGGCLTHFLAGDQTLPLARRLRILCDVANGLEYLHQKKIIHGDLTSPNVLIHADGRALLSDFGLSNVALDVKSATFVTSTLSGNARWIAPELLVVSLDYNSAPSPIEKKRCGATLQSDIYSFGSITLETLTGRVPYQSLNDAQVLIWVSQGQKPHRPPREQVSDELWRFIEECWAPAGRRPSSSICRDRLRQISANTS